MQTWLNQVVCWCHDDFAAPPMECLLPCCSVASSQPQKSAERAKRARASGKERGRLGRMGAPTFLSASRMRSFSSVPSCPSAPVKADEAARLCKDGQIRAPAASLYCSAFFASSACLPCLLSPSGTSRRRTGRRVWRAKPAFVATPGPLRRRETRVRIE